jgi:hypothetical protein
MIQPEEYTQPFRTMAATICFALAFAARWASIACIVFSFGDKLLVCCVPAVLATWVLAHTYPNQVALPWVWVIRVILCTAWPLTIYIDHILFCCMIPTTLVAIAGALTTPDQPGPAPLMELWLWLLWPVSFLGRFLVPAFQPELAAKALPYWPLIVMASLVVWLLSSLLVERGMRLLHNSEAARLNSVCRFMAQVCSQCAPQSV